MRLRRSQGDQFVSRYGDTEERFWSKVERRGPDECWPWTGTIDRGGYGEFYVSDQADQRLVKAHVWMYEVTVGPVPDDHELDHACHTRDATRTRGDDCPHRGCVNPGHLEPVTHQENSRRSRSTASAYAARSHCDKGHLFSGDNLIVRKNGARRCRTCKNERARNGWANGHRTPSRSGGQIA